MVDVTEQAKQVYKTAIIGYLRERCETDTYLAEACKKENKTLDGCVKYIIEEARKKAENNVAVIPDAEVFDWAVHYILEDSLNCEPGTKTPDKKTVEQVKEYAEKPEATEKKTDTPAPKKSKKTIFDEDQLGFEF